MGPFKLILLAVFLFISVVSKANTIEIRPFVKGSFAELKQEYSNQPFVLIFWSESCSYCMKELAMFAKLQGKYPDVPLVVVATDPFLDESEVKGMLERTGLSLQKTWVFAEQFPERIYADVHKRWRGELPVTHFFDQDNREVRHLGIVKQKALENWLAAQQQLINP
ncbi:MAG: hypothetical protein A6F70_03370 [Cycloclasticus sp. symbiont of Bathymodiolus heckerae]|nr:MAG: hypothetical protein A6F70_03370 [Cycloclasticus sp. symbiont of Bathymodiolus heckerae]